MGCIPRGVSQFSIFVSLINYPKILFALKQIAYENATEFELILRPVGFCTQYDKNFTEMRIW